MARSLSDSFLLFVRENFTDAQILDYVSAGNLSPEDAAFAFDQGVDEGFISVTDTSDSIGDITTNMVQSVGDWVQDFVNPQTEFTNQMFEGVMGDYIVAADTIQQSLDLIESLIRDGLHFDLGAIETTSTDVEDHILGINRAQVVQIESLEESLSSKVFDWINDETQTILGVLGRETDDIIDELSGPLDFIQSTTEDIVTRTTDFATALRDTVPEIGEKIVDGMTGVGEAVTTGFGAAFSTALSSIGVDKLLSIFSIFGNIGSEIDKQLGGLDDLEVREGSWDAPLSISDAMNTVLGGLPWIGNVIHAKHPAEFERIRLDSQAWVRPSPLDAGTTLEHIRRYPDSEQSMVVNLQRAGFSDERIQQLLAISHTPLSLAENIVALRREFISPDVFAEKLRALGLAPDDIELAERLSMQLPPIGDLIRMVVRDTFEPDVVEEGRLSEGFDTFPVEIAEQLGIPPVWSEKYWQAHWELPSLQQGFEMLHRGEIDRDALLALFKAADLAPGYWEPMEAISYRPFTRVDVRRMHAFGVLDESQVLRSYLDIGYDQEKAQALTDFTIAYNDSTKKVEKTRERDLSKSDIIGMYNDGVIDASSTRDYLIKLGYSDAEAEVLIDREDIQEMRRERKADISNIIDQAKIKALTFEEAQDRLAALDLTRTETNKALSDLARVSQTRTRTPSKSDLDDWLSLGLITPGDYAEELRTLGYADRYVDLYVEATTAEEESDLLAQEEKAASRREPRSVSKGNLDSLFQAEIIDIAGYTEGLTTLGYRERDIANLLEQQTLKLEERQRAELERLERGEEAALVERLPSRSLLGKLYLKGLISIEAYQDGLTLLGFSPENVELLSKLITAKGEENAGEPQGITQ